MDVVDLLLLVHRFDRRREVELDPLDLRLFDAVYIHLLNLFTGLVDAGAVETTRALHCDGSKGLGRGKAGVLACIQRHLR